MSHQCPINVPSMSHLFPVAWVMRHASQRVASRVAGRLGAASQTATPGRRRFGVWVKTVVQCILIYILICNGWIISQNTRSFRRILLFPSFFLPVAHAVMLSTRSYLNVGTQLPGLEDAQDQAMGPHFRISVQQPPRRE